MKRIFITFFIATLFVSCEDQLDRETVDVLLEEVAYETVDDIESSVVAVYSNYNPNAVIDVNEIFTDNCQRGADNGGQKLNILNQIINTQTNSAAIWLNRYFTANTCNRTIRAAEIVTVGPNEQDRLNDLLGQTYAMRALMHYDLLLYYGEDFTNPTALGVPYQEEVSDNPPYDNPTRLTTQETVAKILGDLDTASSLLDSSLTGKDRVTEDFISFLRAKVALITEDWDGVISNINPIIDKYSLATQEQYELMFLGDQDQTEVVFAYDNVNGFNRNVAGEFIFTGTGGNFIGMAEGLFNLLQSQAALGDIRFATFTDPDDEETINKYPPISGVYINDFKLFRASEAYLMRAEAHARLENFGASANDVQAVRNARRASTATAAAYASLNAAITDIALERRLELCFEGHRYVDLKRYRNILGVGIERAPSDCPGNIPCSVPVDDRRWVLPIPQVETNGNPNIEQNPQWL
jgi:hypothetical protein